jgi:hypothetical protein
MSTHHAARSTRISARSLAAAVAATTLATGLVVATAPAASADPIRSCPDGRVCLFFNSGFAGARADYRRSDAGMGNELFDDRRGNGFNVQVNDNAASIVNNTGDFIAVFDGPACTGRGAQLPGRSSYDLSRFSLKNKVSSISIPGSACVNRSQ